MLINIYIMAFVDDGDDDTLTWVSDDTLAGTLCRWSSLQSTVLAWWYTD